MRDINDKNALDQAIGDMGGDGNDLGQLKHAEAYGRKSALNSVEQSEMQDFLQRAKQAHDRVTTNSIEEGWIPINKDELGIRARFYPAEWEFFVRPATVQAIKNWTAIDEERPEQVNEVFNEIIKSCIRIKNGENIIPWGYINSWDRFWFILKAREYTYSRGEARIEFSNECSECGADLQYVLDSHSLFYEFPDEELIEQYWDGRQWNISPSDYGVDHDDIVLYTPQLTKDEAIINWATAQVRAKQKLDEVFIKFLPWMLQKAPKDPQALNTMIQKCYSEYKSWDIEMFDFMDEVVRNITVNPSEKLKMKCSHCGAEAVSTVQFPNGIKSLFKVQTTRKKFGSR